MGRLKATNHDGAVKYGDAGEDSVLLYIESPVKSFAVSAPTAARKRAWVQAINGACRQLEIDQLEAIKQKMLKRAAEDEQLNGSASKSNSASASQLAEGERGMGDKRISMISRFELGV